MKALDVLFCLSSIIAVALFYCPLSRDTFAALLLLSIAILIPPIVTDATNPVLLIAVLSVAPLMMVFLWFYHLRHQYCGCCYRYNPFCICFSIAQAAVESHQPPSAYRKAPMRDSLSSSRKTSTTSKELELSKLIKEGKYAPVRSSDGDDKEGNEDEDASRDISRLEEDEEDDEEHRRRASRNVADSGRAALESLGQSLGIESVAEAREVVVSASRRLRLVWIGVVLAVAGIIFFALQRNESYWYMHSLWQFFIMSSAYFLVRGRRSFMKYFRVHED